MCKVLRRPVGIDRNTEKKIVGRFARINVQMLNGGARLEEIMVEHQYRGQYFLFKQKVEYEEPVREDNQRQPIVEKIQRLNVDGNGTDLGAVSGKPLGQWVDAAEEEDSENDDDDIAYKDEKVKGVEEGTLMVGGNGRVEVVFPGVESVDRALLNADKALKSTSGAFTEVGNCHRGHPGKGNL
ncbi:hypothetical protein NE237_029715 [Protea cynaroides]|uniref:Uncharacterized protein n=1 Tax=Protea cynaroides TaxID=273540 RepID=A0A9Q0GUE3_9MAGN|nr:hypothetical protein NE237_029715 [Protea cynaroides]